jgi:uncharacterized membrane protein YbhN (UPF0104 family)
LSGLVGTLIAVLGCVFVGRLIVSEWDEVTKAIESADPAQLVAALLLGLAGMTWTSQQWRHVLRSLGADATRWVASTAYFIGQLGKYVPGGIWSVLGRAEFATRAGVPRTAAYPSVGLSLATTYLAALLVAAAAAPWAARHGAGSWALLALPAGLVALHPRVLRVGIAFSERLFTAGPTEVRVPSWRRTTILVARHIPAWLLISASTWLTCRALGLPAPLGALLFATPLSWFIGFAALPVPGGVGVREAVFVAAMASALEAPEAAIVAVTSRLIFVAVDVLGAAAFSAWGLAKRRSPARMATTSPDMASRQVQPG